MNSKGVTPVVATALLLGIAISAVVSATLFMNETLGQVKDTAKGDIQEDLKRDKAEIGIQAGYNRSSWMVVEVQNTGETSIPVIGQNGNKRLYLYIDGQPVDIANGNTAGRWEFYPSGNNKTTLGLDETTKINTTIKFPAKTKSTEIEIEGPYGTSTAIICYNDGSGAC